MSWRKIPINENDLEGSYTQKYGLNSRYQKEQEPVYTDPKILNDLKTAVSWLDIQKENTVLDIGVNNGYELELFEKINPSFSKANVIGMDIIGEVLKQASERFSSKRNFIFIKGDITSFRGTNINTGQSVEIKSNSIDILIALTSLQSSSISAKFASFMEDLLTKMRGKSQLLVGTPDFHLDESDNIVDGLFDAGKGLDMNMANEFSKKIIEILKDNGFSHKQTGRAIIFDYFWRNI